MPLDAAEEFTATYKAHRDSNDSYVESGQEIARSFGAVLVWADWDKPDSTSACRRDPNDNIETVAWFCGAEPDLIRLNRTSTAMPGILYEREFMDIVRHELAHLVIRQRCGVTTPGEQTVELEGVTNSYAVLYLGADRKALGRDTSEFPEYEMTTTTDEVATRIRASVCW